MTDLAGTLPDPADPASGRHHRARRRSEATGRARTSRLPTGSSDSSCSSTLGCACPTAAGCTTRLSIAPGCGPAELAAIEGLTWKRSSGDVVHNLERRVAPPSAFPPLPSDLLGDVASYLRPTFMGARTAVHQAALGCRYRCEFCGVV